MDNVKTLDYQFTAVPTQLMILLDVNCRSMLFTLCQLSSYYSDASGKFFRTNADLSEESRLSQKLVIAAIDTLYRHGIINVWSVGKSNGKHSNYFRLNIDRFKDFERLSMDELKNPEFQIEMVNYRDKGYTPLYLKDADVSASTSVPITDIQATSCQDSSFPLPERTTSAITEIVPTSSQSTNNIDSIENTDNIENEDTINNKETNILNNNKEECLEDRMLERLANGDKLEHILEDFAKNDWDYYQFCKKTIRNGDYEFYTSLRNTFRYLNRKYGPTDEYLEAS